VTMRDSDGKIIKKPFTEFNHPFLMTRRAEVTPLAGEGNKVFVAAIVASNTSKTVLQAAAIEIAKDRPPYLRSQIPQTGLIPFLVYPLQFLEKVLDTAVIVG